MGPSGEACRIRGAGREPAAHAASLCPSEAARMRRRPESCARPQWPSLGALCCNPTCSYRSSPQTPSTDSFTRRKSERLHLVLGNWVVEGATWVWVPTKATLPQLGPDRAGKAAGHQAPRGRWRSHCCVPRAMPPLIPAGFQVHSPQYFGNTVTSTAANDLHADPGEC